MTARMRVDGGVVAVVTGAAGGIGRGVAEALAARGAAIALVDVDGAALAAAGAALAARGARVSTHAVDVADRAAMLALPDAVTSALGEPRLLVCNAGVAVAGRFDVVPLDDFDWIMGVNFWGTVYACRAFVPRLARRPPAHVAVVLSDFALVGFPTKAHYCATKFACRGFAEALRAELHGTGVGLSAVYPGPVDTGLVRRARTPDPAKRAREVGFVAERGLPVPAVADRIVRGIERGRARVLVGKETWAIDLLTRLAPAATAALVARVARRLPFV